MGTEARITLHARTTDEADAAAAAAFDRISALDRALSDYRVDGELAVLAAEAGGAPVAVSDDLLHVLDAALDLASETDGAFDPTAGPLSLLWREARRAGLDVEPSALAKAEALVDWSRVALDPENGTVRLEKPGMRVDLGAIAKGHAADQALATLRRHGISSALVVFGGEIVASDPPPGADGWRIALIHADSAHAGLHIANEAISTSGDTEQYIEREPVRLSHVFDPRTGEPLTSRIVATVIARDGITADAFATAATVLDSAARARFIARHPSARFYVRRVPEG
jgi:thiamine biosynthesis lipoprotein